jgi:hypothetical protein
MIPIAQRMHSSVTGSSWSIIVVMSATLMQFCLIRLPPPIGLQSSNTFCAPSLIAATYGTGSTTAVESL